MMIGKVLLASAMAVTAAVVSGCTGPDQRVQAAEKRWPPIGAFVDTQAGRIHYLDQGQGAPVVLIHGASGNLRDWKFRLFDEVAAKHRAVAFDRPGLGYSDRDVEDPANPVTQASVLREATAKLGIERPILVGHSYGGAIAMTWAVEWPDEVAGVVVISGATYPWDGDAGLLYELAATSVAGPLLVEMAGRMVGDGAQKSAVSRIFRPQAPPEGYADYVGSGLALRPETLSANARDLSALNDALTDIAPRYADLPMPIEVLHGDADKTVWLEVHALPLSKDAPDARLTTAEGVGHMLHHARPDLVLAAIDRLAAPAP